MSTCLENLRELSERRPPGRRGRRTESADPRWSDHSALTLSLGQSFLYKKTEIVLQYTYQDQKTLRRNYIINIFQTTISRSFTHMILHNSREMHQIIRLTGYPADWIPAEQIPGWPDTRLIGYYADRMLGWPDIRLNGYPAG